MKKVLIAVLLFFIIQLQGFASEKPYINIAFAIDNNYPIFTLLAIDSMLKNNTSNANIRFFIVENNLTNYNKNKMRKFVEKRGQKIEFVNIDTKVIDDGINYFTFSNRITPIAMARILLATILPKEIDKVLYLDGDILVTGNIQELYDFNFTNYPVAMAANNYQAKHYLPCTAKCKRKHFYANSGVILMDLNKWREENIPEQLLNYFKINKKYFLFIEPSYGYSWDKKYFLYPDQDLLNVVLDGRIKPLPQRWNNQVVNMRSMVDPYVPGILHYIGAVKPWNFPEVFDRSNKLYMKYWDNSELFLYKYIYGLKAFWKHYKYIYYYKFQRLRENFRYYRLFIFEDTYIHFKKER